MSTMHCLRTCVVLTLAVGSPLRTFAVAQDTTRSGAPGAVPRLLAAAFVTDAERPGIDGGFGEQLGFQVGYLVIDGWGILAGASRSFTRGPDYAAVDLAIGNLASRPLFGFITPFMSAGARREWGLDPGVTPEGRFFSEVGFVFGTWVLRPSFTAWTEIGGSSIINWRLGVAHVR